MDDFKIDARRWRFLDNPGRYAKRSNGDLKVEPLRRQFRTAKEILSRFSKGRGVLLADDVGLGKTTVAALVAWVVACQDKRVRIYAPNEVLQRRWAEELKRHVPYLGQLGATNTRIKPGKVGRLQAGRIQITTHHELVRSHSDDEQRTSCDLMIIDEAHRAKGDGSEFNRALRSLGDCAKRKLILTATPFSIKPAELSQLLKFVGAGELPAVSNYAIALMDLYSLGEGHDAIAKSGQLVSAAKAAVDELGPYLIRHGIDDLSSDEKPHFGAIVQGTWTIPTAAASEEELRLLLRMDRLLQLAPERKGARRNDPRFHIGWQHVGTALERTAMRTGAEADHPARRHLQQAEKSFGDRRLTPHPKVQAVSVAVRQVLESGEKVLVFCHHRATAHELLVGLEQSLKIEVIPEIGPPAAVWHEAWTSLLPNPDPLTVLIIDWLCSAGLRRQIAGWLLDPAQSAAQLAKQIETVKPRHAAPDSDVPTIHVAAQALVKTLLDEQSRSTRSLLKNMKKGPHALGGGASHFPGKLDDGIRVMGAWEPDGHGEPPPTLYTGKPDIVLALFNSPFGPDVLVATDRLSEGVDLHRCCRHLIHYELDPSPVRTLQRNGRVRRVGSWGGLTRQPILYAYPTFGGTRDEKAVGVMRQRISAFGLLLGGVPTLDDDSDDGEQSFAEEVLRLARKDLESLNRKLSV